MLHRDCPPLPREEENYNCYGRANFIRAFGNIYHFKEIDMANDKENTKWSGIYSNASASEGKRWNDGALEVDKKSRGSSTPGKQNMTIKLKND